MSGEPPLPKLAGKRGRGDSSEDGHEILAPNKRHKDESELTMGERKQASSRLNASARVRYTLGKMDEAVTRLKASLKVWPHNAEAYQLLGLIMQDKGEEGTALELWLLQAHFDKKNTVLWQDLFRLARKLGRKREEVFCITQLHALLLHKVRELRRSGKDVEAEAAEKRSLEVLKHRLDLLEEISEWNLAIDGYKKMLAKDAYDAESVHRVMRLYVKVLLFEKAAAVCDTFFQAVSENPDKVDVHSDTFLRVATVALELQLDLGRFSAAVQFIDKLVEFHKKETLRQLHPELSIKACIALAYRGDVATSLEHFNAIQKNLSASKFGDLFFDYAMV